MHGDLATRNILVTDNWELKIADFGMTRKLEDTEYYQRCSQVEADEKTNYNYHFFPKYISTKWSIVLFEYSPAALLCGNLVQQQIPLHGTFKKFSYTPLISNFI